MRRLVLLLALAGCRPTLVPPSEQDLVDAEGALFQAIAGRDRAALEAMVDERFVLVQPGQPPQDKAAFVAAIAAIPGHLRSVTGENMTSRALGPGRGLVSGLQVATVELDGQTLTDRQAFVDVFERSGDSGRWRVVWAFSTPADPERH